MGKQCPTPYNMNTCAHTHEWTDQSEGQRRRWYQPSLQCVIMEPNTHKEAGVIYTHGASTRSRMHFPSVLITPHTNLMFLPQILVEIVFFHKKLFPDSYF